MNLPRERVRTLALLLALTASALQAAARPGAGDLQGMLVAGVALAMLVAVAYG